MFDLKQSYKYNSLQTPHSGYHWDEESANFFEGWYFRITLPEIAQTFAFMYSIQDPLSNQNNNGGAAQILGIDEQYLCRTFPNVKKFWAAKDYLALAHWGKTDLTIATQLLDPDQFNNHVQEGYQVTATLNQGFIRNPSNNHYCRWQYTNEPIYGWGNPKSWQQSTGGLLSYLPIFEPGWQVLMAHGSATGYIDWNGNIYEFTDAPTYSEKNWGHSFPEKWFWINCNAFANQSDLALTAVGGRRKVLGSSEEVALICLHYQGEFYEFAPWNSKIIWKVAPWGMWEMQAYNDQFQVTLTGTTDLAGTLVRVPTEKGLVFCCRDTVTGELSLELSKRNGVTILKAFSQVCGLEVGGQFWNEPWSS